MAVDITSKNNMAKQPIKKRAWKASLALQLSMTSVGCQLTASKRNGPLSVQKAFYPEGYDCAHIYLLHPPAGIVSGDELSVDITLDENAHSLITTPGANRFYQARQDSAIGIAEQKQHCKIKIAAQAKCENFPLETIVYEGAVGFNTVDVYLAENSVYLGWDITCLGLPKSNTVNKNSFYSQLNRVYCHETLLFHDRIDITPDNQIQQHVIGLNQHHVFGTFLAYSATTQVNDQQRQALIVQMRETIAAQEAQQKISVTELRQLMVIRYLGDNAQECKALFIQLWQLLRPHYLEKTAKVPRVWYT